MIKHKKLSFNEYVGIGMTMGLSLGAVFGVVFGNVAMGISFGMFPCGGPGEASANLL